MKILLITSSYSENYERLLSEQCVGDGLQYASNTFQNSLIDGLISNKADFEVLSFPGLPCFPLRFKHLFTKRIKYIYSGLEIGTSERYCTLVAIKGFSIKFRTKKYVKCWIKKNHLSEDDEFAIILYQPNPYINSALASFKRKFPKMKIATIVADFYDLEAEMKYARANYGLLKQIQAYYECKQIQRYYHSIDKYILLTKAMENGIPESKGKNIIIEGLANSGWISKKVEDKTTDFRTVVYTGQLGPNSCIDALVDAFMNVKNPKARLIITGEGSFSEYIRQKSKIDSRIIFLGIISRDKMIELQRRANLLVNPRRPSTNMTKYSFPSKIMEYMAAITPVLTFRLEGIPEEYYQYCYCVNTDSIESLTQSLEYILSLPQEILDKKATDALSFLLNNKTSHKQIGRLLEFITN